MEVEQLNSEIIISIFDKDNKRDDYSVYIENYMDGGSLKSKPSFIRYYRGV